MYGYFVPDYDVAVCFAWCGHCGNSGCISVLSGWCAVPLGKRDPSYPGLRPVRLYQLDLIWDELSIQMEDNRLT